MGLGRMLPGLITLASLLLFVSSISGDSSSGEDEGIRHGWQVPESLRQHAKVLPAFIGARPTFSMVDPEAAAAVSSVVSSYNYTQAKDHIGNVNGKTNGTFKHRYFQNTQYANGSQIHFLYIEGPYTADPTKIGDDSYPIVALAKNVGATLWLLEHRFYGQSRPFVRMYNKNLPYLTSQQAIEDIAAFINSQNTASGESNPKWVVFGSAYGGALALWFRNRYPSLTVGAVASSPLVSLELDNYQYELNLAESLTQSSYSCFRGAVFAARAIRQEMQYLKGLNRLNSELHMKPGLNGSADDYKTFQFVHTLLMPLIQYPVQYNHVNKGVFGKGGGIDDLCAILNDETVKNIDKVYQWANVIFPDIYGSQEANGNWSIGSSYEDFLRSTWKARYANDGVELKANLRLWLWQTCHEFGTWPTTDNGRNIFGTEVPNSYWIALCSDVFGMDIHEDNYDIYDLQLVLKNTSHVYDTSKTYKGSNTVITSGGHDPWRTLVPNVTVDSSSTIFVADGVGHTADFQPPMDTDPGSLVQARKVVSDNVASWVSGLAASSPSDSVDLTVAMEESSESESAALPEPLSLVAPVHSEHPDPEFLAYIRRKTAPREMGGQYNAMYKRQLLREHHQKAAMVRARGNQLALGSQLSLGSSSLGNMTMNANLETWYIEQAIDHFDPTLNLTYQQRYLSNDRYVETKTPPVFLFIGGEGPISWDDMAEDFWQWVQWAKNFRARMYVLEHRFYGDSQPFPNTSVPMLQYLKTEQVLMDITVFINTMNVVNNDSDPRWILFGGSYAGSLAAAHRVRYPDLTMGAIASSAPIQAQVDFWGYERWVQLMVDVYGDCAACGESIRKVMYEFQRKMMTKHGREEMKVNACYLNDWHEDNYVDEKDLQLLFAHYVEFVDIYVQYDDTDHYMLKYVCYMFEYCGEEMAYGYEYAWYCSYLSMNVLWEVGWPHVKAEEREEVRGIIRDAMRNSSDTATGVALARELLEPIFKQSYQDRHRKMTKHTGIAMIGSKTAVKPDAYDDGGDGGGDGSTDTSNDYNDQTSEDDSSGDCEGSNWDGSSGCGEDDGDDLWEFDCYCWYCDFVSYDRHVYYMEQAQLSNPETFEFMDMRTWTWQTCTEWGYMMSDNYGRSIFESTYPVNWLVDQCSDIFGEAYNRTSMENTVRNTNYMYGGQDNYNGTNIMFINGSEDPWHVLSIYGDHKPKQTKGVWTLLMKGTSHCEDMYLWREGDKDVITQTQKKIKKRLSEWVNNSDKKKKRKTHNSSDYSGVF